MALGSCAMKGKVINLVHPSASLEGGWLLNSVGRTIGKKSNLTKGQNLGISYKMTPSAPSAAENWRETYRREYKSSNRFTIGVPVTAHLLLAFNAQTALAVLLARDLQWWASSRTTRSHSTGCDYQRCGEFTWESRTYSRKQTIPISARIFRT